MYVLAACAFFVFPAARAATDDVRDALFQLRAQIDGYRNRIEESSREVSSYREALGILELKKKRLASEKSAAELSLVRLAARSKAIQLRIDAHTRRIFREQAMLGELLRELGTKPSIGNEILLTGAPASRLFTEVRELERAHNAVREAVAAVREERWRLLAEKKRLEKEREEAALLHEALLRQGVALAEEDARTRAFMSYTARRREMFTDLLRRSELASISLQQEFFEREGVGKTLTIREAYSRADEAAKRTGVRPALLLALVAQESRFGKAQGTGTWKDDMDPAQWPGFLYITKGLSLNPDAVPVSKKPSYGWGGAMGPAQFLPLTWLRYEELVRGITGHETPSPWNIDDAFTAAALKLAEAGAAAKTEETERRALLMYFAGENWDNPAFAFYADEVLGLARDIEEELLVLTK